MLAFAMPWERPHIAFSRKENRNFLRFYGSKLSSSLNDEDESPFEPPFYDDFGDSLSLPSPPSSDLPFEQQAILGDSQDSRFSAEVMESFRSRVTQARDAVVKYDAKLARNWRNGNWSVRGFALDKESRSFQSPTQSKSKNNNGGYESDDGKSSPSRSKSSLESIQMNDENKDDVHISIVVPPTTASLADYSLASDKFSSDQRVMAVGRSDGSVFLVELGTQYLTKFTAKPKLVVKNNEKDGVNNVENRSTTGMTVQVENEWITSDDSTKRIEDEKAPYPQQQTTQKYSDTQNSVTPEQQQPKPFHITHQFQASKTCEPIQAMMYHDDLDSKENFAILCTASGNSGEISVWSLPQQSSSMGTDCKEVIHIQTLEGVHSDRIVSLKLMVLNVGDNKAEHDVLFSASRDGTFALWDLNESGKLILDMLVDDSYPGKGSIKMTTTSLTCADVSSPKLGKYYDSCWNDDSSCNGVIYLGTADGLVIGFAVDELLSFRASKAENVSNLELQKCPEPNIRFRAHGTDSGSGGAVTAIQCGGDGTIPISARLQGQSKLRRGNSGLTSSILLTGGEDGSVKQWEILTRTNSNSPETRLRMEHWPRLSSQRMKRRAHVFTPCHDGPVTSLAQQSMRDSSKFLSCGVDGSVRVWSASSGKELFRMEGFSKNISSLACLGRDILVTDGMEEYVCIHDFSIDEDEEAASYDLEW